MVQQGFHRSFHGPITAGTDDFSTADTSVSSDGQLNNGFREFPLQKTPGRLHPPGINVPLYLLPVTDKSGFIRLFAAAGCFVIMLRCILLTAVAGTGRNIEIVISGCIIPVNIIQRIGLPGFDHRFGLGLHNRLRFGLDHRLGRRLCLCPFGNGAG